MKKIFFFAFITALMACEKEYDSIYTFPPSEGKANVKFIHALPNVFPATSTTAQAGLQVYLNDVKVTGNNITYGGGVFPGLEYAQVPAGNLTLKAVVPATATAPEVVAVTGPVEFTAGKTYSVFLADTLPTPTIFRIEEDFAPQADSGKYFVRLVNLTPKSGAYDLYGITDATIVIPNVAYKTATPFVQVQVGSGARQFTIRKVGSNVNIGTPVSITPVAGRMYTIFSYGIDGGTGARIPRLAFFTSRFQK
ncbi:MAG TPA: DUF4397 domain-containing protein [Chitinophagaceae bacterium]|nr:DUF4397 domain-containing protein [Chitinophagaceae bacterium]